jgi:hypothetical protein
MLGIISCFMDFDGVIPGGFFESAAQGLRAVTSAERQ